jgi:prevent-host-death family protein
MAMTVKPITGVESFEIPAGEFKNRCLALMDEVEGSAREYVITKHGRPVARLVAATPDGRTSRAWMRGTVVEEGDIVSPDFESWGEIAAYPDRSPDAARRRRKNG